MSTGMHTDCACCGGLADRTPVEIVNRPGLPAISYRAGAYPQFRASLLAGLSRDGRPALRALTTRETDDFSIALLDAWAVAADVITFYTERIANEHYLGTATERGSIAGQAALLGYRLKPGVATSAWLAITAEATPGGPDGSPIPAGTRVQTIPGPGELPQSFETAAPIVAFPAWNRPELRMLRARNAEDRLDVITLAGVETGLRPGDEISLVSADWAERPDGWSLAHVQQVDLISDTTRVEAILDRTVRPKAGVEFQVFALRQRSAPFGANAIDPNLLAKETRDQLNAIGKLALPDPRPPKEEKPRVFEWAFAEWSKQATDSRRTVTLSVAFPGVEPSGFAVLANPAAGKALCEVRDASATSFSAYGMSGQVTQLTVGSATTTSGDISAFGGANTRSTVVSFASDLLEFASVPITDALWGVKIPLDRPMAGLFEPHDVLVRGTRPRVRALEIGDHEADASLAEELLTVISIEPLSGDPSSKRCVLRMDSGEDLTVTMPIEAVRDTHQPVRAHQPRDAFAAHVNPETEPQLGQQPRRAIGLARVGRDSKEDLIRRLRDIGVRMIVYVILHDICKDQHYDVKMNYALNTLVYAYDDLLEREAASGVMLIDRNNDRYNYLEHLFQHGLNFEGREVPVTARIRLFRMTNQCLRHPPQPPMQPRRADVQTG